ncbi:MAG: cyclase family protein [Candidatus Ventricola sp.]
MKIIDISQEIRSDMTVYPGDPRFHSQVCASFKQGDMCEVSELTIGSHCGTHVDAPLHMIPGGATIESMPLDCFVGPCRVLTFDAQVITEKMLVDCQVAEGERILLRTDPKGQYTPKNGHFNPAVLSMRAAQYLAQQHVKLVGIDAPTVENMEICDGEIHRTLLGTGVAILEGLRLEKATGENYFLSALPLSLTGENGAPCRAVLIEE